MVGPRPIPINGGGVLCAATAVAPAHTYDGMGWDWTASQCVYVMIRATRDQV